MLALICVAILYGRTQADKLAIFGVDNCEGQPCFMGIIPGITKWNDIPAHLKGYEIQRDSDNNIISVQITDYIDIRMEKYPDTTPFVTLITIDDGTPTELMTTTFPSVDNFIAKYGSPCLVLFDNHDQSPNNKYVARLVYPTMTVDVDNTKPFVPTAVVNRVQLMTDDWAVDHHDLCTTEPNLYYGLPWAGFTSIERYWAELAEKQNQR